MIYRRCCEHVIVVSDLRIGALVAISRLTLRLSSVNISSKMTVTLKSKFLKKATIMWNLVSMAVSYEKCRAISLVQALQAAGSHKLHMMLYFI
jgi:hypothetical protein